jgi:glycosidase
VLFCVGGVPSVYYGDEQAFRGVKEDREGGDDEIRPAFPASPSELLPDGWPVYRLHQRLIGFRRRHPWLVRARTSCDVLQTTAMALRVSGASAGEQVLLLLNSGDEEYTFGVDASGLSVVETPSPDDPVADPLTVPPHSWRILA